MDYTYWQKQTLEQPLFDDIIWGKPQQKTLCGKLLIVGGNSHAVASPIKACSVAIEQIVGDCTVAMPDKTRSLLGPKLPPNIELLPSTAVGSFSSKALDSLRSLILQNDSTIFAGDFGHNSETAILLENVLKINKLLTFCGDSLDYWSKSSLPILRKPDVLLVLDLAQLQKYAITAKVSQVFTSSMDLLQLVEKLHEFTNIFKCHILTKHGSQIVIASKGKIITTKFEKLHESWQVSCATAATVWWLQNPKKPLESIATSITQLD
jgi:hypothetical protein